MSVCVCVGGLVPLQLHPGGDRRPAHLLHGGERHGRHGGALPLQGAERHGAQLCQGGQARSAGQAGLGSRMVQGQSSVHPDLVGSGMVPYRYVGSSVGDP